MSFQGHLVTREFVDITFCMCSLDPSIASICVSILFLLDSAAAASPYNVQNDTAIDQTSTQSLCGFDGNTDLYGVGIRVGYYTQAMAVAFANFFVLRESKALRPANTLFMLAMAIGLLWISRVPSQVYAVEAFMLLQIILATWFVGVKDVSRWSSKYWTYDPARAIIRTISVVGILIYNFWFWHLGLESDGFMRTPCGTYIFFFAKVDLYGWFRSVHKGLSTLALIREIPPLIEENLNFLEHWKTRQMRAPAYFTELTKGLLKEHTDIPGTHTCTSRGPEARSGSMSAIYHDVGCSPIESSFPQTPYPLANSLSIDRQQSPDTEEHHKSELVTVESVRHCLSRQETNKTMVQQNSTCKGASRSPNYVSLLVADKYVTSIIGTPSASPIFDIKYRIPHTPISLSVPRLSRPFFPPLPRPFRFGLLLPLFHHIYKLYTHPFYTYPHLLSAALTHPSHRVLDPSDLRAFLALRRTRIPVKHRKWFFIPSLLTTATITMALVLAIELGIVWNGVRGVNAISGVGQLLPLVLGVGGLAKVGWAWLEGLWSGRAEEDDSTAEVEGCAEAYYQMKMKRERQGMSGQRSPPQRIANESV